MTTATPALPRSSFLHADPNPQDPNDSAVWVRMKRDLFMRRFDMLRSGDRIWMGDTEFLHFLHPDFRAEHLVAHADHYVVDLRPAPL